MLPSYIVLYTVVVISKNPDSCYNALSFKLRLVLAIRHQGRSACGGCRLLIVPPELLHQSQHLPGASEDFWVRSLHSKLFRPVVDHAGAL